MISFNYLHKKEIISEREKNCLYCIAAGLPGQETSKTLTSALTIIDATHQKKQLENRISGIEKREISPLTQRAIALSLCPLSVIITALSIFTFVSTLLALKGLGVFAGLSIHANAIICSFSAYFSGFGTALFTPLAIYHAYNVWRDTSVEGLRKRIEQEQEIINSQAENQKKIKNSLLPMLKEKLATMEKEFGPEAPKVPDLNTANQMISLRNIITELEKITEEK